MERHYTTREVADVLGTDEWRIRRLFEIGAVGEPRRFAGKRAISQAMIPQIVDALRERGWISENEIHRELRGIATALVCGDSNAARRRLRRLKDEHGISLRLASDADPEAPCG